MRDTFDIGRLDLGFSNFQLLDEDRGFSYLPEKDDSSCAGRSRPFSRRS